jgi:hypothetical protein
VSRATWHHRMVRESRQLIVDRESDRITFVTVLCWVRERPSRVSRATWHHRMGRKSRLLIVVDRESERIMFVIVLWAYVYVRDFVEMSQAVMLFLSVTKVVMG